MKKLMVEVKFADGQKVMDQVAYLDNNISYSVYKAFENWLTADEISFVKHI
jgi:hypothetical protein